MDWHLEKDPLAQLICGLFGCEKIRCVMNKEQEIRTRKILVKKFRAYFKKYPVISVGKLYLNKRNGMIFVQTENIYKVGKLYKIIKKRLVGGQND